MSEPTPLIIWLSGGPGCSSLLAAVLENGPCTVEPPAETEAYSDIPIELIPNEFSWHKAGHILWVDQPAGTGYSTSRLRLPCPWPLPSLVPSLFTCLPMSCCMCLPPRERGRVPEICCPYNFPRAGTGGVEGVQYSSNGIVAEDMGRFLLRFLDSHDQFRVAPVFVFGESFAGHYVPAVAHHIHVTYPEVNLKVCPQTYIYFPTPRASSTCMHC